jgi:dihydroorotate dehydrogenase electron transfer subunit
MMETAAPPPFMQVTAAVAENVLLARDTYRIRLEAPELAGRMRPGQFVMLRLPGADDPLLGRPFALYDTVLDADGRPRALDIVYLVVGKLTGLLAAVRAGEVVEIWGPLGNGFASCASVDHVGLIAGGIGQTPFLALVRQLLGTRGYGGATARREAKRVSLFYGIRSGAFAAGVDDFRLAGAEVYLASDDGTLGFEGYVTDLLRSSSLLPDQLIGCGPTPMLRALAALARDRGVPCQVSLETPMACGVGICFSCVTPLRLETGSDYRRVCIEGPIFDAQKIDWEDKAG